MVLKRNLIEMHLSNNVIFGNYSVQWNPDVMANGETANAQRSGENAGQHFTLVLK